MTKHSHNIEPIRRKKKESAVTGSAYVSRRALYDRRTETWYDFRGKPGLLASGIVLPTSAPPAFADPSVLWNAAEAAEKHPRATVGRRHVDAIPHTLPLDRQIALVERKARWLVATSAVAVEWALHAPDPEGDPRNTHAHFQQSSRRVTRDGFGEKSREWDRLYRSPTKQWVTGRQLVSRCREVFCSMANEALAEIGSSERMDHRTLKAQRAEALRLAAAAERAGDVEAAHGLQERARHLDREPTKHAGRRAIAYERKTFDQKTGRGKSERVEAKIHAPKRCNAECRPPEPALLASVAHVPSAPAPAAPTASSVRNATGTRSPPRSAALASPRVSIALWKPTPQQVLYWRRRIQKKDYGLELERVLTDLLKYQKGPLGREPLITRLTSSNVAPRFVVELADGGKLIDRGERIVADPPTPDAIAALAAIAKSRKWHAVQIEGSVAAQRQACVHLARAEIEVHAYVPTIEVATELDSRMALGAREASVNRTPPFDEDHGGDWNWEDAPIR